MFNFSSLFEYARSYFTSNDPFNMITMTDYEDEQLVFWMKRWLRDGDYDYEKEPRMDEHHAHEYINPNQLCCGICYNGYIHDGPQMCHHQAYLIKFGACKLTNPEAQAQYADYDMKL